MVEVALRRRSCDPALQRNDAAGVDRTGGVENDYLMPKILSLLAAGPGFPTGSTDQGLELRLPLTMQGQIDPADYFADDEPWPARRFRPGRPDWRGEVALVDAGDVEAGWCLRGEQGMDEPVWTLDARIFRPGDYITIRRPDGEEMVFRIVSVEAD